MSKKINYIPEECTCCGQSKTYALAIDKGTVHIVKQVARFIGKKGINCVHPRKEMEGSYLSSNEVGNLSRARFHGLIARVEGEAGNYLLTRKGAEFLRGVDIPRIAVISKVTSKNAGYLEDEMVNIHEFDGESEYWEGIGYTIAEGNVINAPINR